MSAEEPLRYPLQMSARFGREHTREETIGSPVRFSIGGSVTATGLIVDWTDEPDGTITLTVEAREFDGLPGTI